MHTFAQVQDTPLFNMVFSMYVVGVFSQVLLLVVLMWLDRRTSRLPGARVLRDRRLASRPPPFVLEPRNEH